MKNINDETFKKSIWHFYFFCTVGFLLFIALLIFLLFPIIFMNSIELQRKVIFTNRGLHTEKKYFEHFNLTGYRNLYVSVKDQSKTANKNISLGVWHLLPNALLNESIINKNFSYDKALKCSNFSVLLYFHGTGEDRSSFINKYKLLRANFHVIAFDYRSYADSSEAKLSEDAVVNDCKQLYSWLLSKTEAPIYVWGHSLGSALSARTVAELNNSIKTIPDGLFLEAPFTSLKDELYYNPYSKIFSWLPWFKLTVVDSLHRNGFIFNTVEHILQINCPIMIMNSQDDKIVLYKFGEKLFEVATKRQFYNNCDLYYQAPAYKKYNHFWIYKDPYLPDAILNFLQTCAMN